MPVIRTMSSAGGADRSAVLSSECVAGSGAVVSGGRLTGSWALAAVAEVIQPRNAKTYRAEVRINRNQEVSFNPEVYYRECRRVAGCPATGKGNLEF